MKYKFEHADHINDYLEAIKGCPEFVVAEKEGGYTVINYVVQTSDLFPDPDTAKDEKERRNFILRRECRGIIFDTATGKVTAKRLHKFFNVNERPETQVNKIDFSQPHVILEKLDGSMITPVWTMKNGLRWGTKMGCTDVAKPVEAFVAQHPEYVEFAIDCRAVGSTPIFEWCSRQQKIVIDYPEDQLVLIAVRHNNYGWYDHYSALLDISKEYNIPVVKAYVGTAENMQALIDATTPMVGCEGFVVRFDDGHMIKVKAEDYLLKHKTKDAMSFEKNVVEILVREKADDMKAFMDEADLARFNEFEEAFWTGVKKTAYDLSLLRHSDQSPDRKSYAVGFVQKQKPEYAKFLYRMFEYMSDAEVFEMVKDAILSSCGTQTKINDARWMFGDAHWNEVRIEE